MSYQRLRGGVTRAASDLVDLVKGLEAAALERRMAPAAAATRSFFNSPTGQVTAVSAPLLGSAAAIGLVDASQGDITPTEAALGMHAGVPFAAGSAVAAGMAAPTVGRLFSGAGTKLAEAERRVLLNDLANLNAEVELAEKGYSAYDAAIAQGRNADDIKPKLSRDEISAKRSRADALKAGRLAEADAALNQLYRTARTRGGALTAAGLGLLGLTAAYVNQNPDPVVAVVPTNDPFLEPHGWSAINSTERMKNWAAGRADEYDFGLPF